MTALSIQPPYPTITDIDGQPLEDGYIWIGVANLPPIGNPIAVYWDAALTQPAALPVRTRGGYPVNAGTPARLYVNSDYSIQVQNRNGSVIYSAPDGASDRFSSAQISFLQAGSGAVVRTAQSKMRDVVSVKDFGAVGDGVADDTAAFNAAQGAAGNVTLLMPPGTYVLNNFRPKTGVRLIGFGYEVTAIKQGAAGNPAVNCTSDVTTGQISSAAVLNCKVIGETSATAAAVLVAASGVFAVWKSQFDFVASQTFRALEVQGAAANNVFRCDFKVTSQDTTDTAVLVNGGTYNNYDLFLTNCANGKALNFVGANCTFTRAVSDGQLLFSGNGTVINSAVVEEIPGSSLLADTYPACIVSNGFNETFVNPRVILSAASAAKVLYAFRPFDNTVFFSPVITASTLANPFMADNAFKFSIIRGKSNTTNKMNTIFTDSGGNANTTLRRVSFIGDCTDWLTNNTPTAGKAIQYLAPNAPFNFTVNDQTSAVIWEPTGAIAFCNLNLPQSPVDGQVVSFSTTQTITTLNIGTALPSGVNVSLVPTTIAANTQFSVIYYANGNKWYVI